MNKFTFAAVAAAFALSVSSCPASAQAGSAVSLIVHASIVSKCQNRQLTQEEAQKTAILPFSSIWKAMKDCQTAGAKK